MNHKRISIHASLGDFTRCESLEATEMEVLNRSVVTISARNWVAFEAWLDRPAETVPALVELAQRRPSWEAETVEALALLPRTAS